MDNKRLFDLFFSILGLIVLLPVFAILAIWIKLDSLGPVFFRQERVGKDGKIFLIHKFRSMYVDSERRGQLTIGSDNRITKSGKFIRKYKLDEFPQLIDVIQGNMSLVGPRPEVVEFMDKYPLEQREKILSVRPGITDYASVKMVDENQILAKYDDPKQAYIDIIMPMKAKYYIDYVDNISIKEDVKIILLTLQKIIFR